MLTQSPAAPYLIEHALGKGCIARYHTDGPQVDAALTALYDGGADGISLGPWMMQQAVALGAADTFLDWDANTGRLAPQMEANVLAVVDKIVGMRFHFIQVAPQFYSPDPRKVGMNAFISAALFMDWLTGVLDAARIPWVIDIVPEFNDVYKSNAGFAAYVQAMWARSTLLRAPGGIPCWSYTMSFIDKDLDCLPDAFQGNWPADLFPHLYPVPGSSTLMDTYAALKGMGQQGKPWTAGEDYSLEAGDEAYARQWTEFAQATKTPIKRFCPWPIPTSYKTGDPQILLAPPLAPAVWNNA